MAFSSRKPSQRALLRVLYVDYSIGFGGATKSLGLVLRSLAGVEPLILTSQVDDIVETWYAARRTMRFRRIFNYRNRHRYEVWTERRIPYRWLRWVLLKAYARADDVVSLIGCGRILWLLHRHRCDLVHLNNYFVPLEAIVAARIAAVPLVVHMRDYWKGRASLESSLARPSRVIAVSEAVASALPPSVVPPERIVTIHDPVDPRAFEAARGGREDTRREWEIPPDAVAFGIFGRVVPWKGQLEFVRAVLRAIERCPFVWGVIVGDQSDAAPEYFTCVKELIRSSTHGTRFVLAGYQSNVERWYWTVDVVVHASTEPEPFGMVVPEAMTAGRPVIAADAGGPREMITHGLNGLLVPPGDIEALAEAILELAWDPEKRRRMGANGYSTVRHSFDFTVVAQQVRSTYDAVLAAASAGVGNA